MILFILVFLLVDFVCGALLASSKLEACTFTSEKQQADGTSDEQLKCSKKMVVILSLEHGQKDTEKLEVLISDVKDDDKTKSLVKPWSVSVTKSKTIWRYPISYIQDVNNQPYESITIMGLMSCNDNVAGDMKDTLSCGYVEKNGEMVPDSEGFCCACSFGELFTRENDRGGKQCNYSFFCFFQ